MPATSSAAPDGLLSTSATKTSTSEHEGATRGSTGALHACCEREHKCLRDRLNPDGVKE